MTTSAASQCDQCKFGQSMGRSPSNDALSCWMMMSGSLRSVPWLRVQGSLRSGQSLGIRALGPEWQRAMPAVAAGHGEAAACRGGAGSTPGHTPRH